MQLQMMAFRLFYNVHFVKLSFQMNKVKMMLCYCTSAKSYGDCCGPYIDGKRLPLSPEALMRSRYSAYAQANILYIEATMCDAAAHGFDAVEALQWAKECEWLRLEVLKARYHRTDTNSAMVEFKAYYRLREQEQCLHEKSNFIRKQSRWFYCGHV
jgi:SEC-C motif-containing protein